MPQNIFSMHACIHMTSKMTLHVTRQNKLYIVGTQLYLQGTGKNLPAMHPTNKPEYDHGNENNSFMLL